MNETLNPKKTKGTKIWDRYPDILHLHGEGAAPLCATANPSPKFAKHGTDATCRACRHRGGVK